MLNSVYRFTAMGSPCAIQLCGLEGTSRDVLLAKMQARVMELEARYTRYRDDSLTAHINALAGEPEAVVVDDETAALLDYAHAAWEQSEGLFDITSGVLRRAWDFRSGVVPTAEQVDKILRQVGWGKVEWEWPTLRLPLDGMELDFGGVVKEYAVDQLVHLAQKQGVSSGWVDLGGDVGIIGPQPDGTAWRIGLRSPEGVNVAAQILHLHAGSVASSGDYERCMVVGGKRYGHVLNPHTGWPVEGVRAVSVVAPNCLIAGTASTVAMLKGKDAESWLEELGLPWLLIAADGHVSGPLAGPENPAL